MTTSTDALAKDYAAFRNGERLVRLEGWGAISLRGPDTAAFLQGLSTQDLSPGASARTYFLTEKGRPLALAWIRIAPDGATAWVVADEGSREQLLPHFERFRVMEEVEFESLGAAYTIDGVARTGDGHGAASGPTEQGIGRIETAPLSIVLAPRASSLDRPLADPSVFEPWRIAVGLPRGGVDFDLDRLVTELDDPDAISLTKGCYVGQEVVARTSNRGHVRRHRVGFRFEAAAGPLPARAEIRTADQAVGFVTSAAIEPGTGEGLGMGYVASEALVSGSELFSLQGPTTIPIRQSPWPMVSR